MRYFVFLIILCSFSAFSQTSDIKYTRAWGTYFDAEISEETEKLAINDIDTDTNGNIWLVGTVYGHITSTDFITPDAYQSDPGNGTTVGFMVKFSSNGNLLYGTFFGGVMAGTVETISIRGNDVYISGGTYSTVGVATPGAYDEILTVNTDPNGNPITGASFIAKFNDLGAMEWATYFQGNRLDLIYDIKAGYNNDFFIWGGTTSSNLATPGAFRETIPDPIPDSQGSLMVPIYPFLARFNALGQLLWATYYAPDLSDENLATNLLPGMAVDTNGNIYVGGASGDTEGYYGTPGTHQPFGAGNGDFFVGKFSPSGQRLWGTYFGGPGQDGPGAICIPRNKLIISGLTNSSSNIATPGTWQDNFDANTVNSFVTKFDLNGQQMWGSYLSGYTSSILSVDVNLEQDVFVYGTNNLVNEIEYEGNYQEQEVGDFDNRILKLNPSGSMLEMGHFPFRDGQR